MDTARHPKSMHPGCPTITWTSPSTNSAGSMPLGNGDIGVNAWAERAGDLLLYLGKGDAWDESGRLLKLGRLRLRFSGEPFAEGKPFRQTLLTRRGEMEITAGAPGAELRLRLWVDANQPVVRIEAEGDASFAVEMKLEPWRTTARTLPPIEDHCPIGKRGETDRTPVTPDLVLDEPGALSWAHRNEHSVWAGTLQHQDLGGLIPGQRDPLLHLTVGALVRGDGLQRVDKTTLRSQAPARQCLVSIHVLAAQTPTLAAWRDELRALAAATDATGLAPARTAHRAWWETFWQRSHLVATGTPEAEAVTQGYNLQRFLLACSSRGRWPAKFNGAIFNVDGTRALLGAGESVPETFDADYRMWGGGYWFQNTRLLYWPMLLAGDLDLMAPFFRLYREALPLAEARTRAYYGHGGAFFPETMTFWGTYLNENYGYDRTGTKVSGSDVVATARGETTSAPLQPGDVANSYIRRYWQGGIELVAMMLDYHAQVPDEDFRRETLLPLARAILTFYREHYQARDDAGKISIRPTQSLETWHVAVNPLPEIAGLQWVITALLALPGLDPAEAAGWTKLRDALPPVPTRVEFWNRKKYLIPAESYDVLANSENPELYAVFPYRLYGVGRPELDVGRETYVRRLHPGHACWRQDGIQAALLGLTDEARQDVVARFTASHPNFRFPAFFGPNYDWLPDFDHGGAAMTALQRMLLQTDGQKILLLPAWPKEWDVSFKFHAPQQTTVECVYQGGEIRSLVVTPEARRADVQVLLAAP